MKFSLIKSSMKNYSSKTKLYLLPGLRFLTIGSLRNSDFDRPNNTFVSNLSSPR